MVTVLAEKIIEPAPIKIDIGCGSKKQAGHIGLDRIAFDGVDHVLDVGTSVWPFENGAVAEAYTSHCVEHLTAAERVHFCNELYRVLAPGGKCTLIVPHWGTGRAYGDPTHQWPPMGEFWFYYLSREWRLGNTEKKLEPNAPHTDKTFWAQGFDCDFECTWGYGLNPVVALRNAEHQQFAVNHYREAIYDIHATLMKR